MVSKDSEGAKDWVGYTLRITRLHLNKLHYIAEFNNRPVSYELRPLITKFITEFEKKHGEITISSELNEKLEIKRQKHIKEDY